MELQDTDASGEIFFSEELLLFKPGEGGPAVSDGVTEIGREASDQHGRRNHLQRRAGGASALGQIYEVVVQLRGEAGQRQVANAKVGLAHVRGALGHSCVTILKI